MERLVDLLRLEDRFLTLVEDADFLQALAVVADTWRERRAEILELGPSDIFEFIESIRTDDEFFAALSELGVDEDNKLRKRVEAISDELGRIPEKLRKFLRPLSDFDEATLGSNPGLVLWTILDRGNAQAGGDPIPYSYSLEAGATIAVEAGDTWPIVSEVMPDPLLRIGFRGTLKGQVRATIPLNFGSLTVGTSGQVSASIDYYFAAVADRTLYARAIGSRIGDLCNPFSLDAVWKRLMAGDLRAMVTRVDGSTSLSLNVGVAEGFTLARDLAQADVGLTVSARVTRRSQYNLVVRALPSTSETPSSVEVTLLRERASEGSTSLSLGVDIDLGELADRLRVILQRHYRAFSEILEEYGDYLYPGTYLREKLDDALDTAIGDLVESEQIAVSLKDAVESTLGMSGQPATSTVERELKKAVSEALDSVGDAITGNVDVVVAEVTEKVAAYLELESVEAIDGISVKVAELVGKLRTDLEEKITALPDKQLRAIDKRLKKIGIRISGATSKADKAFRGVREVIGKYEGLLKKLIGATQDAARTRIAARLTREETHTTGSVVDVRMFISTNSEVTAEAFDTLLNGDMDGIVSLLDETPSGIDFDRSDMALTRFAEVNRRSGFELVLLGFEFGTQSIFDADAHVTSDGLGKVSVTSNATWTKRKSAPKEARELQFIDAFELAAASQTKSLSLDVSVSHLDQALNADELRAFLASFESAALIPPGTAEAATGVLLRWGGANSAQPIKADVAVGLSLNAKAVARLLQQSGRLDGNLKEPTRREIFRIAIRELGEAGAYGLSHMGQLAEIVRAQTRMEDTKSRANVLYDYTRTLHRRTLSESGLFNSTDLAMRAREKDLDDAQDLHELCQGLVDFVDLMGDIFEAVPSFDGSPGWTETDYLDAQKQLNTYVRRWMRVNKRFLLFIDKEAHPRTVAFLGALIALSGAADDPDAPAMSVTMVRRDGNSESVTLV